MQQESVRILLVEDNPGDSRLVEEMLRDATTPMALAARVDRLSTALEAINVGNIDVVLLDLNLPDSEGIGTFEKVHTHAPLLPVIVLSGFDNQEMALRTVHEGAQDYLVKGHIEPNLLERAIRYAIERSHIEQALASERDLFQALLDNLPDRIYFKDAQSRFIRINPALARDFKLARPAEAIGETDFEFYSAEEAARKLEDELYVMRTGEAITDKIERIVQPDGSEGWLLTTKLPLRDRHGRIIGTTGISRDITDIKDMQNALDAERNLLRSVIDHIPDPIFVKDVAGYYELDNEAHRRTLGVLDENEVVGKTSFDFFPPDIAQEFTADDARIIETGRALVNHEESASTEPENPRWLLTTKVPLTDETGRVMRMVCIRRDITEQKLAEEQLRKTNEELRTAMAKLKHATEELRMIQMELIEAEKMKSVARLAAGIAHEVKNPLAVVTMGIDYLAQIEFPNDDNVPMILHDIRDAVGRADNVIRGLLDFSAPKQIEVKEENLNAIIERSLLLVRGEMKDGKFEVVKELASDLPRIQVDRPKIEQVLVNILTNAIHAMVGGGTLTVRTFTKQLTGAGENIGDVRAESFFRVGEQVAVVEVDDTGTGIPEDKATKIFDPFFTTKPTGKGTGLGLTVTRGIIDLHGGTIQIANRPEAEGRGARVTIMLKL